MACVRKMVSRPIVLACPNSSVGQSSGLIIRRSSVQARLGALIRSVQLGFPAAHYVSRGCGFPEARLCHPVTITRRRRKMPLPRGNASSHGQSPRNLPWPTASPSPGAIASVLGAIASVPGVNGEGDFFALAISGGYRFKFTGYRFTLDGDAPKPPKGERDFGQCTAPLRESAHKGPGVLKRRANEPSMTICALLCPR